MDTKDTHSTRVLQAQGMISVQAACSMDKALALMESTAFATDEKVEFVAREVLARRVRFDIAQ